MNTEKPTITWPDILNYLYDTGYFSRLSPVENKLHDGLLIKLNNLFFREYLEISNTELIGVTGLSLKAIVQARKTLIQKLSFGQWVWRYISNAHLREAGKYYFNYELIMSWKRQKQVNNKSVVGQEQASEALPNNPHLLSVQPASEAINLDEKPMFQNPINHAGNGNDPNTTETEIKKTTTATNDNKFDDDGILFEIKDEIKETLKAEGLAKSKIEKAIKEYGWERVIQAFCDTRDKYIDGGIYKGFVNYFLGILNNKR